MTGHLVPTRAEVDGEIEKWREWPGFYLSERLLLARLDEAERLPREVRETMWDEERLCAEIHAFLKGDNRDRPAEDEADPRLEQWS